ncbi:MAG: ATP-binding protein [Desulfuromonadaceae bacterium]|nr:ATP-binding protein [Desulfuromonadaceae bacterium]
MKTSSARIPLTSAAALHVRAEERLAAKASVVSLPENRISAERIVHELEVHQIELEMQNTELREARFEVETALEKYTDLYEFAPVGYLTLDRNGAISAMNLAAANLLRIMRSLLIGRQFGELVTEESTPTYNAFIESVFTSQRSETCEIEIVDNAGLPRNLQVAAAASASGGECHLALIDITDRRENILQKEQEHEKLEQVPTVLSTLKLELSTFCLRDALDSSLTMLKEKIQEAGVRITSNFAVEVDERIVADWGKVKLIIFSLLSNAVKFTPAGGTVGVSAVREGHFIKITVADSGIGIRGQDLLQLFLGVTPHTSVYTKKFKSTGLGLALIRLMVELHGGTIWAESEIGTGSRFSFTIPLRNCAGIT